jgi:hypothetical protein
MGVKLSLTLREEHILRVFGNRVLRRISRPKRDEVPGECRKLHNKELNILYSSPNVIKHIKSRRMRWVGHVAHMGKGRKVCRVLMKKPERKRQLERPRQGRMGSEWILLRLDGRMSSGFNWLRTGLL